MVLVAGVSWASMAHAEYPERTIHIVVPWKAGGGTDTIARGFQKGFDSSSGQTTVIDNINGAKSVTGTLKVSSAKSDGYTVLLNGSLDMTSSLAMKKLPYTLDSFKYIGGIYTTPTWILTNSKTPYKDFGDFLKAAKENPGKLSMGTSGATHALLAHAIKGATGLDFLIVPFNGGADLKKAMIGNDVDVGQFHAPVMISEVKAGLIRPIVATMPMDGINYAPSKKLKTLKDFGIDLEMAGTRGLYVPKSTPDSIVAKLRNIAEKAAKSGDFAAFGESFGFAPVWVPGKAFEAQLRNELKLLSQIKAKYIK